MTIPNIITILRLFLVPAVVSAMLGGEMRLALYGFVAAGISDAVDGFIARKFDQRSALGAWLDPIADKLLLVSVFVVLGWTGDLPVWLVVLAVGRDMLIAAAVLVSSFLRHPVQVSPLFVSKANTTVQIVLAALILFELAFAQSLGGLRGGLVVLSALLTVGSAAAYLVVWLKHMNGYGKGEIPRG